MADQPRNPPADPEQGWPPRFDDAFLARAAVFLLVVFAGVAGLTTVAFLGATAPPGAARPARDVAAYLLFVVGVLALLLGAFFALVEAKKPMVRVTVSADIPELSLLTADLAATAVPTEAVAKAVDAFGGRRVSAVLLGIGFTLVTLAAAGAGLVSLSVGDAPAAVTPAPAPSRTP